jgi:glycosyltransferase involved in cell wall biosynthesis
MFYLDVTRLVRRLNAGMRPTGVDRVGLAYVRRYGAMARAVISARGYCAVLNERQSTQTFADLIDECCPRFPIFQAIVRSSLSRLGARSFDSGVLLHTSHTGLEFPRFYTNARDRKIRVICMIHDLIPITHPEYCRPKIDELHQKRIHAALRYADGLVANSHDTEKALAAEAQSARLRLPPTIVAHLAPGVSKRPEDVRLLDRPYFVMLGTIEPRKNHWFLLHVWRRLVELQGESAPALVIIGRRGWECENAVDMLERSATLRGHVFEISNCTDMNLHAWLSHAQALLFPSFAEGYGMPLVEAMSMRIPVIASDLGVFREIAAGIPDYLDPLDGPGWVARITEYSQPDSPRRNAQLRRLENFHEPTWDAHFERVDHFIETLTRR